MPSGHPFVPLLARPVEQGARPGPDDGLSDQERDALAETERLAGIAGQERELREIRDTARQAGFEEGRQAGLAQALAEGRDRVAEVRRAFEAGLEMIDEECASIRQSLLDTVIPLAIQLAEKLVGMPVAFDRAELHRRLIGAIEQHRTSRTEIVCCAHPETVAQMAGLFGDRIVVETDPAMMPGGVIVDLRNIDGRQTINRWNASIERQIAALKNLEAQS